MSLIDDVRKEREDLARVLKKHVGIRKIVEDLYPDNAHFLYELLQNAEDTGATEVNFILSADRLAYEHNGRPFEIQDVEGITDIGEGTKADDDEKIGRFGVGFKAVFAYSETPHIWSPTFSFKISELVLPTAIPEKKRLGKKTRFEFPFNNPKKPANTAYAEIKSGLDSLNEMTLLFLNNIETISWKISEDKENKTSRLEHTECHVELIRANKGSGDSKSAHYLRFKRPVAGLAKQYLAIAFQLEFLPTLTEKLFKKKDPLQNQFRITSAIPGKVSVYFPAEKETSGLRFHLHAPFVPELSRASIKDTPANLPLYHQLAALTTDSLSQIRDLGLLTGGFLAVLPNSQDIIPARYEHIRASVITAMNEKPLTPTHSGHHAPARRLYQSKATLKDLLSKEDIKLLTGDSNYEDWAIGAPQGSNQDKFLSKLMMRECSIEYVVGLLLNRMSKWYGTTDESFKNWLSGKSVEWHQQLYALLYREEQYLTPDVRNRFLIRCKNGYYWNRECCYFPAEGKDYGHELFLVDEAVYKSGTSQTQQKESKTFLESIAVRIVSEKAYVEKVLERRYIRGNLKPEDNDLERFIELVEDVPSAAALFAEHFIFKISDEKWVKPSGIFIDQPFRTTGLRFWYASREDNAKHALSEYYHNCGIMPERLARFAEAVGAQVRLEVKQVSCRHNPDAWNLYHSAPGRLTDNQHDEDYDIEGIANVLKYPSVETAKLIWQALRRFEGNWVQARYCKSQAQPYRKSPSCLAHHLKNNKWVPQEDETFLRPSDASIKKLPQGFPIDKGWSWLREIGFGENEEVIEQERLRQVEEKKKRQETAKSLGFSDERSLQDAQKFVQLAPEERMRFFAEQEKTKSIDLPNNSPKNPHQRAERVGLQALDAPERTSEKRLRTVAVGKSAITKGADQYLQQQYTNADGQMICQVCREELPFKLSDDSYYFETVEFLPDLNNRHYQNHLALCPNHAAMFKHANESEDSLSSSIRNLEGPELAIKLAGADAQIYFTTTHLVDLKAVIDADTSMTAGSGSEQNGSSQEVSEDEFGPTLSDEPEVNAPEPRIEEHDRQPLSPIISPNAPEMVQCPKCSARVRKDRLERHIRRKHINKQTAPFLGSIAKKKVASVAPLVMAMNPYENCPICRALFKSTMLVQHILKVHPESYLRFASGKLR